MSEWRVHLRDGSSFLAYGGSQTAVECQFSGRNIKRVEHVRDLSSDELRKVLGL